jgi:hypothetical protein
VAAAEVALATVLLIGAGLFLESLENLQRVHLGFEPHQLPSFQLSPSKEKYPLTSRAPQLYRALLDSMQSVPGVRGASVSSGIPFGAGGEVRSTALTEEFPSLYYPMASRVWPMMDIVVRTDGSAAPEALLPAIREKVHEFDPELALANVRTMEQWLANSAAQPRLNTVMLSVFAFVALLIASVGI